MHQAFPDALPEGHGDLIRIANQQQPLGSSKSPLCSLFLYTVAQHAPSFLNKTAPSQGREYSLPGAPIYIDFLNRLK